MRARDRAKREGRLEYKALRNRALALVRRDKVHRNLDRVRRGGQSAAWALVAETRGKAHGELPLPEGCFSNGQAAAKCNEFYITKVEKLSEGLNRAPSSVAQVSNGSEDTLKFSFHGVGVAAVRNALFTMTNTGACGTD